MVFLGDNIESAVAMRMVATQIGFSRPASFGLGMRFRGHLRLLRESILCLVSCGFRLQSGWCISQAQNSRFRAQNFDLHRSDPQRSRIPNNSIRRHLEILKAF